jgi:hypothetical protein
MMKRFDMRVSLIVCLAAMIWGAVAHAEPGVSALGVGSNSCGKLIATIGKIPPGKVHILPTRDGVFVNEYATYQEWLMGFVTGFNAAHTNEEQQITASIDSAGMDLWMRNWCNQHPTQTVFQGALAFIDEMRSNAGRR